MHPSLRYNRIMKKQLKGVIDSRAEVVKSMSIMNDATELIIQRVAFNSQSETFSSGGNGMGALGGNDENTMLEATA